MFDSRIRPWIDPMLNAMGRRLARRGVTADALTLAGLALGLFSAVMIAGNAPGTLALIPLVLGRVADGLDGAVARATRKTDFGGFLDITADFAFYGAVPLAFALRNPDNTLSAAILLAAFYINGASFLAFATLAAKRAMTTTAQGEKSLYFSAGLMEGAETILVFAAFCLWPWAFPWLAGVFAALCLATTLGRVALAYTVFRG